MHHESDEEGLTRRHFIKCGAGAIRKRATMIESRAAECFMLRSSALE